MAELEPIQRVAFRVEKSGQFRGDVTAVFPDQEATPGNWVCYAHVGQHSECGRDWYYGTRPAKPEEYKDLLAELESIGYRLRVVRKISR